LRSITSELARRKAIPREILPGHCPVERVSRLKLKWILRRKGKVNKGGTAGMA